MVLSEMWIWNLFCLILPSSLALKIGTEWLRSIFTAMLEAPHCCCLIKVSMMKRVNELCKVSSDFSASTQIFLQKETQMLLSEGRRTWNISFTLIKQNQTFAEKVKEVEYCNLSAISPSIPWGMVYFLIEDKRVPISW